jgi:hypothetical protein
MYSSFTQPSVKRVAIVSLVVFVFGLGVWQVLKSTVDRLLYWDATAAAESWAKYVAENVTDQISPTDSHHPRRAWLSSFGHNKYASLRI